ncbi:molybdopterin-dependent oxidoreductase [Paucibacter sp. B2R-40]|uniref:molybdopterin-dependent oxidoreductase n=1 Tax=Paucibacter sp. B2R-40 TaxID=2893554 RepID=UPI0021E46A87|nr:molybdopterin-dependent oxidoreductase [Paucibacter sp. B2R-40]MCV2354104.1 molybdopterin-dependent oxidoreductase [Paucibacter sp. B2R-40]
MTGLLPQTWSRRLLCGAAAALFFVPAWGLEPAGAGVVLTISGMGLKSEAKFDMAMLAALPQHSFITGTPWYPTARKFSGPLLRDVLAAAGVKTQTEGKVIEAIAINDYKVSIPIEDAWRHKLIVARLLDDKPMALRDKGPLFLIYPFDSDEQLRNSIFYSRSAWQLKSLRIK